LAATPKYSTLTPLLTYLYTIISLKKMPLSRENRMQMAISAIQIKKNQIKSKK
jgi:hypothetical protein